MTKKPAAERLADAKRALARARSERPVLEQQRRDALLADDDAAAAAADLALEELHRSTKRLADLIDLLPSLVAGEANEVRFPKDIDQAQARLASLQQRYAALSKVVGILHKPVSATTDSEHANLRTEIQMLETHIKNTEKLSAPAPEPEMPR